MISVKVTNLTKAFNQPLLSGLNFSFTGKGVVALIGDNGTGKSTLLKILSGQEEADGGSFIWSQDIKIGYLPQEIVDNETLSGGQKKIVLLSQLIYSNLYDVLFLDEPDNHLDLENKLWLERAIADFDGLIVMISHDRQFLENVTQFTWLIEDGVLQTYPFGFKKFREVYEDDQLLKAKKYKMQLAEKKRLEAMAQMFHRKSLIGAYRNTQKRLERHLAEMVDDPSKKQATIVLSTKPEGKLIKDKTAILVKGLVFGYDQQVLFDQANLHLFVGDKVALLSPNGTGKTTLVKLLLGELTPLGGEAKVGVDIRIGYYSQEHAEALTRDSTPLATFMERFPLFDYQVEAILRKFFFSKQTVRSKIWTLSGGQKARLQLALFLYQNPDVLILDEPTNHLDLKSVLALENFLVEFPGAVLLVSHDRQLVRNVAERVYKIKGHRFVETEEVTLSD